MDLTVSFSIGIAHGLVTSLILKYCRFLNYVPLNEILILFMTGYCSFVITESMHYSGVIALLITGIILGDGIFFYIF